MPIANLFATIADPQREFFETLISDKSFRLERIVSHGQASPPNFWYDQDEAEWVALLSGSAELTLLNPDENVRLHPGDHLLIAAHRKHRVHWTDPMQATVWLALFFDGPAST